MQIAIEENDAVLNGVYYMNSANGREAIKKDFSDNPAILKRVFTVWGKEPTMQDGHEPTLDELKAQKKTEIAAARYEVETSGTTVNGVLIDTGRDSQALITSAALAAVIDSSYSLNWKTDAGFIHLSAPEIIAVAQAVRAHVQACFDREGELVALVDAAKTVEDLDEIIISWPV